MQTFMPYSDFDEVASVLDSKRLNKQLLEGRQILAALAGTSKGWRNHPATKMWAGSEGMLYKYLLAIAKECNERGIKYQNNLNAIEDIMEVHFNNITCNGRPFWMKDKTMLHRVITTHQANLYRKDSYEYGLFQSSYDDPMNDPCCEECSYFWPTHIGR
ncbi:MAG: hypothetical protein RLZZ196_1942 [Bacteroidota bacterium]